MFSLISLKQITAKISGLSPEEVNKDSPLQTGKFQREGSPQTYCDLNRSTSQ
jgi:hypothetical protein